jgi:hypothetical protein
MTLLYKLCSGWMIYYIMDICLLSSEGFTNLELNQASFDDLYFIPNYEASRLNRPLTSGSGVS